MGRRGRLHDQDAAQRLSAGVDRIFAALADPVRRRAVELLGQRPHSAGELADTEVAAAVDEAGYALSE